MHAVISFRRGWLAPTSVQASAVSVGCQGRRGRVSRDLRRRVLVRACEQIYIKCSEPVNDFIPAPHHLPEYERLMELKRCFNLQIKSIARSPYIR